MASPRLIALGEKRRTAIYRFIVDHIDAHSISPTIAEIAEASGIQPSAVRRHVGILIDEGKLTSQPGKARTLRPVRRSRRKAS